jgi:hypothetical protein
MRISSVLLLLSLAACDHSPTAPAKDLLISASVSPATVSSGSPVTVQITVINRGSTAQVVDLYAPGTCGLGYEVLTMDGTDTNLGRNEPCPVMLVAPPAVEAGATYTFTQQWSTKDRPLATGSYVVRSPVAGPGVENVPAGIRIAP